VDLINNFTGLHPLLIIYFSFSTLVLLVLISNSLMNSVLGPFLNKYLPTRSHDLVSVLVPARNEEKNISVCIESLIKQDYPNFEIIILNDNSTDNTYEVANSYLNSANNIKVLNGDKLPEGWLGKNWACHQLAQNSHGRILIFTDADNYYESTAVSKTVSAIQKHNLDMLSAFPQQITDSFSQKLIIPVIDLILYSGLILWTTVLLPFKVFAAANGQWIAFKRESYFRIGGHESVKMHIVEDVALSRIAKSNGLRLLTLAGTGEIYGKMYSNFKEVWNGLSKNIYGLTDFKPAPFFALLVILLLTSVIPYIMIFDSSIAVYSAFLIALNLIWRLILGLNFKHYVLISTIMNPLSILSLLTIGINSYYKSTFKQITWKDREIKINKS